MKSFQAALDLFIEYSKGEKNEIKTKYNLGRALMFVGDFKNSASLFESILNEKEIAKFDKLDIVSI